MDRKEILSSPSYWATRIQIELYNCAERYMRQKGLSRSALANELGVSRSYVTQLLSGDFDHRLSKLTELVAAFGCVPVVEFVPADAYFRGESIRCSASTFLGVQKYTINAKRISSIESIDTKDTYPGDCKLIECEQKMYA